MPLKGKTKRDVVCEFRNAEILEAARKVFAQKGFSEASVEDIAQEAGLAKGTLYLYYPSKHAIYWAALQNGLVDLSHRLKLRVEAETTIAAKIRTFIETKLLYFEENRDFFKIYYAEFGNAITHPAFFNKDFKEFYLGQLGILKTALEEGIQQKSIRALRIDVAASAIFDITRGVITQRLLGWSKSNLQEDIELLFELAWKGLACQ